MNNNPTLELLSQVNGQPIQNPPMGANMNGMITGVDMNNQGNVPVQNNVQMNPYDPMANQQGMNMGVAQPAVYPQGAMATSNVFGYPQENMNAGVMPPNGYTSYAPVQPQMNYQQPNPSGMDYGQTANMNMGAVYEQPVYSQPQMMPEQGYAPMNNGMVANASVVPSNGAMNEYPAQPDFSFIPLNGNTGYVDPNATMYQQSVAAVEQVNYDPGYAMMGGQMPMNYQQPPVAPVSVAPQPMDYSQMAMQQPMGQPPMAQPMPTVPPMGQPMPQNVNMVIPGIPEEQ